MLSIRNYCNLFALLRFPLLSITLMQYARTCRHNGIRQIFRLPSLFLAWRLCVRHFRFPPNLSMGFWSWAKHANKAIFMLQFVCFINTSISNVVISLSVGILCSSFAASAYMFEDIVCIFPDPGSDKIASVLSISRNKVYLQCKLNIDIDVYNFYPK